MPPLSMVDDTLSRFRKSHVELLGACEDVAGFARQYEKAKPAIHRLRDILFQHFTLQKSDLFETLRLSDDLNREEARMLESLQVDLRNLKITAIEFFDQYPADMGDIHPVAFPSRFQQFFHDIQARINLEEQYLIPLIRKVKQ